MTSTLQELSATRNLVIGNWPITHYPLPKRRGGFPPHPRGMGFPAAFNELAALATQKGAFVNLQNNRPIPIPEELHKKYLEFQQILPINNS
ncbi:acyl-CoA thioesterase family protein [Amazonocrinis nigriterrae]|uniref:hypothetical protein n=1 Tax=Amazonocrinis nigriterrae TaxID=2840443 RepID=UPI001CECE3B7|nr:hypothetical protein [Amazonocrinis nigriterrae]